MLFKLDYMLISTDTRWQFLALFCGLNGLASNFSNRVPARAWSVPCLSHGTCRFSCVAPVCNRGNRSRVEKVDQCARQADSGRIMVEWAGKPNFVFRMKRMGDHLSKASGRPLTQAPYPRLTGATMWHSMRRAVSRRLFGLAGGGVYPAAVVTNRAVRSYRTISTLPADRNPLRRCIFCGTVPRVAPGWRYQPPRPAQFGLSSQRDSL